MATTAEQAASLKARLALSGPIEVKPMFGEYGVYLDGKIFGLICDGYLFIKKTPGSELELGPEHDASPYPGAKPHHRLPPERLEDEAWLATFVQATVEKLPAPKPKKPGKSVR